jgi:hypothetical protein
MDWYFMKSYSSSFEVTDDALAEMVTLLKRECLTKLFKIEGLVVRYVSSLVNFSKEADSHLTLVAKVLTSRSMDVVREDYDKVPWYRVLSTPLSEMVDTGPQVDEKGNLRVRGTFLDMDVPDLLDDDRVDEIRMVCADLADSLLHGADSALDDPSRAPSFINE